MRNIALGFVAFIIGIAVQAQQVDHQKDQQQSPSAEHCDMVKRGNQAMGFSQEKTAHHFPLFKDGGAIEVAAADPKDTESR